MNRHMAVSLMLAAGGLSTASRVSGQGKALDPTSLEVFNRTATSLTDGNRAGVRLSARADNGVAYLRGVQLGKDRKSTRLNSSHLVISYAVFCLKKKKKQP